MARTPTGTPGPQAGAGDDNSSAIDRMLLAALEGGDDSLQTGRTIITYKDQDAAAGMKSLGAFGLTTADARDFTDRPATLEASGADALMLPEIGVAIVDGPAFADRGMSMMALDDDDSPILAVEPEYFVFADGIAVTADYLRGFRQATDAIAGSFAEEFDTPVMEFEEEPLVLGATWGLRACRVPQSHRTGAGIRVAVLDTGMDLGHPEFAGRHFVTQSFVGQPVHDLHSHGTHCIGTACGPLSPPGSIQRYGIAHQATIFVGKVLSNSGSGATGSVLAGMNWAIANKCAVISMSLGSQSPVQAAYTAAGQAAFNKGCLIIAASGNAAGQTGAPANSPTIVSVASLDQNLSPSSFSNFGKVEIAAPGRDVFSSVPRPTLHGIKSGTSMATPHVAGCAALWAQTSPALRGRALRRRILTSARALNQPASKVGRGLVQAP